MHAVSWWRRFMWRHPEWWTLGLSLLAWLLIIIPSDRAVAGVELTHHHHGAPGTPLSWIGEMFWWIVMVIAMMLPLIVDSTRVTAARSLWARRNRAICVYLFGYLAAWILAGVVVSAAIFSIRMQPWFRPAIATLAALGLAAVWQLTAFKRRVLRSCHRTIPMAPSGWRANLDCLRYGWMIGGNCLLSCGALMVACSLSGHNFAAMAGAGSISAAERYLTRPNQPALAVAIAVYGIICAYSLPR
jgi:predicted metal-binding membrane protein